MTGVLMESFMRASNKARVLNVMCLVANLLALIGCIVGFAASLFKVRVETAGSLQSEWHFHMMFVETEVDRIDYSGLQCSELEERQQSDRLPFCAPCTHGGRTLLAMLIIAFPILLALLVIQTLRVTGGTAISLLAHPAQSLYIEHYANFAACIFYFIGVVAYGATCYHAAQQVSGFTPSVTDFAFLLTCFFLLTFELLLLAYIRQNKRAHLGWQASLGAQERFTDGFEEHEARLAEEEEHSRQTRRQSRSYSSAASSDVAPAGVADGRTHSSVLHSNQQQQHHALDMQGRAASEAAGYQNNSSEARK